MDNTIFEAYMEKKFLSHEGRRGLENLAKLCSALGYKDSSYYGQLQGGAALGDIFEFLQDNSGAINAIVEWVDAQKNAEWEDGLKTAMADEGTWWIVEDNSVAQGPFDSKEEAEEEMKAGGDRYSEDAYAGFGVNAHYDFIALPEE